MGRTPLSYAAMITVAVLATWALWPLSIILVVMIPFAIRALRRKAG